MVVEERNKLQTWCDVLIVVTKYSKVQKWTTCSTGLSSHMGVNSFLLLYCIYLCTSLEKPVFWESLSEEGGYKENVLVSIFKKNLVAGRGWGKGYLPVQSQQEKQQNNVSDLFKVNNKDTSMTSLTLPWCPYCELWTDFTHCSGFSIVHFKQLNPSLDKTLNQLITYSLRVVRKLTTLLGTKYSRIDQVKFVEDSLYKIWSDIVCLGNPYHLKSFKGSLSQILLGPSWIPRPTYNYLQRQPSGDVLKDRCFKNFEKFSIKNRGGIHFQQSCKL